MSTEPAISASAIARSLVGELESSGLTVAAFCRERGLSPWAMYTAAREARGAKPEDDDVQLAKVTVVDDSPRKVARQSSAPPIEIALPSGLSLRVPSDFDDVTLRRILGVLAPC